MAGILLGCTQSQISKWERNKHLPDRLRIESIEKQIYYMGCWTEKEWDDARESSTDVHNRRLP